MHFIKILFIVFVVLAAFPDSNFSQTSSLGNYEIYTKETAGSSIGYLSNNLVFSDAVNSYDFTQNGIMYINERYGSDIGTIVLSDEQQIRIAIDNSSRIGFATGAHQLKM